MNITQNLLDSKGPHPTQLLTSSMQTITNWTGKLVKHLYSVWKKDNATRLDWSQALPIELWMSILHYVDPSDLIHVSLASKRMYVIANDVVLWKTIGKSIGMTCGSGVDPKNELKTLLDLSKGHQEDSSHVKIAKAVGPSLFQTVRSAKGAYAPITYVNHGSESLIFECRDKETGLFFNLKVITDERKEGVVFYFSKLSPLRITYGLDESNCPARREGPLTAEKLEMISKLVQGKACELLWGEDANKGPSFELAQL